MKKIFSKKVVSILLMVFVLMFNLIGCGSSTKSSSSTASTDSKEKKQLKVALLLPGSKNDQGWNTKAYEGLQEIEKELGAKTACTEKVAASDYEEMFKGYANQGFDIVIGHGYEFGDAAKKVAPDFPNTTFMITSSNISQAPNVASIDCSNMEQGFLAGVVAAKLSKSKVIGAVGGMQIPSVTDFNDGFVKGAAYVDPNVKALTAITGDFDDASKAKETANAMISQHADIITHMADQAGLGIFKAVSEAGDGVYAIGSVKDQSEQAKGKVITSVKNELGKAMLEACKLKQEGKVEAKAYVFGVKDDVVGILPYGDFDSKISSEDKSYIDNVVKKIASGEIKVKEN